MRIISFNVNGIRATVKKGLLSDIEAMQPDVLCLQETKATGEQVREAVADLKGYHIYTNEAEKKGYSGTAIFSRKEPRSVQYGIQVKAHDNEGRVITAEYDAYYVVCVYVPNSGAKQVRLDRRLRWDKSFRRYLTDLMKVKPVIVGGDFNVAFQEIDIARPKSNYNKSSGYLQVEIDGFEKHLSKNLVDVWRQQHPEEIKYSYWNQMFNSRSRNVGWRIDYFLVDQRLADQVVSSDILNDVMGSDHCPIEIVMPS
ncbi:MAG: exodeoxyribonuclease III [Saprospiraceae bacterium]|nr:exodeoxyribonuclease III [Saprospiraceae bacterium]